MGGWRRISGAERAAAARATEGGESLSVTLSQETATSMVRSTMRGVSRAAASGKEFTTKPGASSGPGPGRGAGARCDRSGVEEHRTGGRSGRRRNGRSMVSRHQAAINSGAAPTRRGAEPLLKRKEKQSENIVGLPLPAQEQAARFQRFVRRTDTVFLWPQTGDTQSRTKNRGGAVGCTTRLPSVMPLGRGKRR